MKSSITPINMKGYQRTKSFAKFFFRISQSFSQKFHIFSRKYILRKDVKLMQIFVGKK